MASEKWSGFTFTARPATDARQRKSDEPVNTFPLMECRSDSVLASPSHESTTLCTTSTLHIRLWDLRHSGRFCASTWASQLPPVRSCAFVCDRRAHESCRQVMRCINSTVRHALILALCLSQVCSCKLVSRPQVVGAVRCKRTDIPYHRLICGSCDSVFSCCSSSSPLPLISHLSVRVCTYCCGRRMFTDAQRSGCLRYSRT